MTLIPCLSTVYSPSLEDPCAILPSAALGVKERRKWRDQIGEFP
jgi:hypothetical protein